jgi:hypothetical protein
MPISAMMTAYLQEGAKMRSGLLFLFWLCILGTIVQAPLLCYEFWLLATSATFGELTVWVLLTDHLTFLAWVADLITAIFGAEFGNWILGLPVTAVTSLKLIFGTLIGYWALNTVRKMDSSEVSGSTVQSAD